MIRNKIRDKLVMDLTRESQLHFIEIWRTCSRSRFPFPVSRFPFPVSRSPFPVSRSVSTAAALGAGARY